MIPTMKLSSKWITLSFLLLATFMVIMDIFIINVAIPSIQNGLQASSGSIQLMIAVYLIAYASFLITGSRAGDYYGRKKIYLWALVFFTVSSCFCGLAQTAFQLNVARFFQGMSAAFLTPQVLSYIQFLFPLPGERSKAFGIYGIVIGLATMSGQLLGGILSGSNGWVTGWRLIFFINLPICIIGFWGARKYLKATERHHGKFDVPGVVLLTSGLIMLIAPLALGRDLHWPAWTFISIGTAIIILLSFGYFQRQKFRKQQFPLIDPTLFTYSSFAVGIFAVSFFFMMLDSYFMMLSVYLQEGRGLTSAASGTIVVFQGLGFMVSSLLSIRFAPKYGKKMLQFGTFLIAISIGLQAAIFKYQDVPFAHICVLLGLHGLGVGMVLPSLLNVALRNVPKQLAGVASGVYVTFEQTAAALGITLIGGTFFTFQHDFYTAFRIGMVLDIGCLIIFSLLVYKLPAQAKKSIP